MNSLRPTGEIQRARRPRAKPGGSLRLRDLSVDEEVAKTLGWSCY